MNFPQGEIKLSPYVPIFYLYICFFAGKFKWENEIVSFLSEAFLNTY